MSIDDLIPYIFVYSIAFIIAIVIIRAIFRIPTFLKLQKAHLEILVEIAKQQGVKIEVLNTIYNSNELTPRSKTNEEIRADLTQNP